MAEAHGESRDRVPGGTRSRPRIDGDRLLRRLAELAAVGDTGDGGVCRLACTDADRAGRDLVVTWMRDLGMAVTVDGVGNIVGTLAGAEPGRAPVMTGSHIDTVATGGRYDGNLGVLAGLEVAEALLAGGYRPRRGIAVGAFSNEEGARFPPDMMGSLVYVGGLPLEEALATVGVDGAVYGEELARIGYQGASPCPAVPPHAFVELHIEQGPLLEAEGVEIGVVESVQGISWQELTIRGQSNHAGTTPMHLRRDPGLVAAEIAVFVRRLAREMGGRQVGTVGRIGLVPNLVNVVAREAVMTVDVRNTDEVLLQQAEARLAAEIAALAAAEGVTVESRQLARFEPVLFDDRVIDLVESVARAHGRSTMRMPSGAGHDAQMLARVCPTGMIFVPSEKGISHNPREHTDPAQLVAGADVLLDVLLDLTETEF